MEKKQVKTEGDFSTNNNDYGLNVSLKDKSVLTPIASPSGYQKCSWSPSSTCCHHQQTEKRDTNVASQVVLTFIITTEVSTRIYDLSERKKKCDQEIWISYECFNFEGMHMNSGTKFIITFIGAMEALFHVHLIFETSHHINMEES